MLAQQHCVNVLWLLGCPVLNYPENTRHLHNVVLMLARRLRRRPNIKTTLGKLPHVCWEVRPLCAHYDGVRCSFYVQC